MQFICEFSYVCITGIRKLGSKPQGLHSAAGIFASAKGFEISEFHEGKLGKRACVRREKVYVKVVENCPRKSLMPIIQGLTLSSLTIYADGWNAYDGLILNGYEHHRVFHHESEFARGKSHVNGIEDASTKC